MDEELKDCPFCGCSIVVLIQLHLAPVDKPDDAERRMLSIAGIKGKKEDIHMRVLIINMYDSCYNSSITYLTDIDAEDIPVRPEWLDNKKSFIFSNQVFQDLENEGLNIDTILTFDNADLIETCFKIRKAKYGDS